MAVWHIFGCYLLFGCSSLFASYFTCVYGRVAHTELFVACNAHMAHTWMMNYFGLCIYIMHNLFIFGLHIYIYHVQLVRNLYIWSSYMYHALLVRKSMVWPIHVGPCHQFEYLDWVATY
jgi:hypothetical protein